MADSMDIMSIFRHWNLVLSANPICSIRFTKWQYIIILKKEQWFVLSFLRKER